MLWLIPTFVLVAGAIAWWFLLASIARARVELAARLAELAAVPETTAEVRGARRLAHDGLEAMDRR